MKILINDLREIATGRGKMVRFSLTLAEDDGRPLMTQQGWRITQRRAILPPMTRTMTGNKMMPFVEISKEFDETLQKALNALPSVGAYLGETEEVKIMSLDGEVELS